MARDGPQGDFMHMAKQASMGIMYTEGEGGGAAERRADQKEKRANAEGKMCAFCGLRFMLKNTTKYGDIGSSPKRKQQKPSTFSSKDRIKTDSSQRGDDNKGKDGKDVGKPTEEEEDFTALVPNFGYTFTERMMLDVIKHMVHRGVQLQHSVCDDLRVAFGSRQSGEMTVRAKSGGNGMAQKVCRLCYEVQNSQRSLEALGRQYARAMGVPMVPKSISTQKASKMVDTMIGPGRTNLAQGHVHGGPSVYAPYTPLYHPTTGTPLDGRSDGGNGRSGASRLPPGSLTPKQCHWIPMSKVPRSAYKYRLTFMFHELQDFPDVKLDELEMELQYVMVEHVHRMSIGHPIKLGESTDDLNRRTSDMSSSASSASSASSVADNNNKDEDDPFILCPIKHVRMHYVASGEESLHDHVKHHKVPFRILVRARRGEAFATAVGNATIGLERLASHISGTVGTSTKTTFMLPIDVPPLGTLVVRMSIGFSCISDMEGETSFADQDLRVTRSINKKGGVFWFPEDHFDLNPLPSTWMGSFNLDLEARSRAIRTERNKKRKLEKKRKNGKDGSFILDDDPREIERERLYYLIEASRERLLAEFSRPEKRTYRQKLNVEQCKRSLRDVQSMITTQSQSSTRSQARLLVLAHSKMLYERRMNLAKREEEFLDSLEHHVHKSHHPQNTLKISKSLKVVEINNTKQHSNDDPLLEDARARKEAGLLYMFREELHAIFHSYVNHPIRKKTRRFRRSGSLDGNVRGEKRIILSEEEESPMVPLDLLMSIAKKKACPVDIDSKLSDKIDEDDPNENKIIRDGSKKLHSHSGASPNRTSPRRQLTKRESLTNVLRIEPQALATTEQERTAIFLQNLWSEIVEMLNNMHASGMYRARWSDIMASWNSVHRSQPRSSMKPFGSHDNHGTVRGTGDFLLDQEAGIEGGDVDKLSENIVRSIPGEVNGAGGGDDNILEQTYERKWIRLQATRMLFAACVSQQSTTLEEDELSMLDIDVFTPPSGVVDVSELRAFLRGVVHSRKVVSLKDIVSFLEKKLVTDLDEITHSSSTLQSPKSAAATVTTTATAPATTTATAPAADGEDGDDIDTVAATDNQPTEITEEEHQAKQRELLSDPTSLNHDDNFAIHDHLYYYARAVHRAALELSMAIENSDVWREVCELYSNMSRDSTLAWSDFMWLSDHAYQLRVGSFRRSAYHERQSGNTEMDIGEKVGAMYNYICLVHGLTRHYCSDGRCCTCEEDAKSIEPLRIEMYHQWKVEDEAAEAEAHAATEVEHKSIDNNNNAEETQATRLREARKEAKKSIQKGKSKGVDERQRRRHGMSGGDSMSSLSSAATASSRGNHENSEDRTVQNEHFVHDDGDDYDGDGDGDDLHEKKLQQKWSSLRRPSASGTTRGSSKQRPKSAKPRMRTSSKFSYSQYGDDRDERDERDEEMVRPDVEELDPTIEVITTHQKPFPKQKRSSSRSSRPTSAPHRRDPLQQSRSNEKFRQNYRGQSLEAQNRARDIAAKRIAAIEGSGQVNLYNDNISQRTTRLREQLEKSHSASEQRNKEIQGHLKKVRNAMEKEIRASLLNNRRTAREARAKHTVSKNENEMMRSEINVSTNRRTRKRRPKSAHAKSVLSNDASGRSNSNRKDISPNKPLHEQKYMVGILAEEQQKVMSKVQKLIAVEFNMNDNHNMETMDPTVLKPMLRSALIKYARLGDLDAVRDLLDAGVDPDTKMVEAPCRTLLQEAARTGRTALAELLVENGASIAIKDDDGFNSLYHAYNSGHGRLAERLVAARRK